MKSLFCGTALALAFSHGVYAQAATAPAGNSGPDQSTVGAQTTLQEVVVTAQRRSANIQTVPSVVVAISKTELEQASVSSASDLTRITPGLNFAQSSYDSQPTIRGIGSRATGPGDESNVAVYVDGVYQAEMPALNLNLNNVQNIQVLEGPQGALYGRNATGGAIIIELTKPSFTPLADLNVNYGSWNHEEVDARISGPILPDVAAELDLTALREDGYIKDIVEGKDVGGQSDTDARFAVLYKPNDKFSAQINAHYSNRPCETCALTGVYQGNAELQTTAPGTPIASRPWTTAEEFHPSFKVLDSGVDLHVNYDFGAVLVTFTSSFNEYQSKIQFDNDLGAPNFEYIPDADYDTKVYTNELLLTSHQPGPFQWSAGVDQYNDSVRGPFTIYTDTFASSNIYNTPGCENAVPVAATCNIIGVNEGAVNGSEVLHIDSTQVVSATAGFVDGTYEIFDALYLNAGARYTTETHNFVDSLTFDGFPVSSGSESKTWENFSPHGSIRYQFADHTNVYASVSTGFKSGVFNAAAPPPPNPVNPETVTAYEIGVKTEIAHSLRLDASVFDEDYQNLQVQYSPSAAQILLENAATANIKGADLNADWAPTSQFDARLGVELLDAKFTRFPGAAVEVPSVGASAIPNGYLSEIAGVGPIAGGQPFVPSVAGNWLIRTPPWTVNLGANYHWPVMNGELTVAGNVFVSGPFYWDVLNTIRQDSYALLSANVSWRTEDKRWKVYLTGDNLTNAAVTNSMVLSGNGASVNYIHPLSVIVGASYSFR
jgi:iron complex outermembrane receptor protein